MDDVYLRIGAALIIAGLIAGLVAFNMWIEHEAAKRRHEALMAHQTIKPPRLRPADEDFLEEITADL